MLWLFGLLWKTSLLSKSCCGYFLDYAWQHLGSFISTSGHTDDDADDDNTLLKIGCGGDGGVGVDPTLGGSEHTDTCEQNS